MKTYSKISKNKSGLVYLVLIIFFGLSAFNGALGQEHKVSYHDYLMPKKGKSMLELYSGIPYVAIGQYSYGFSDRFSVGILYGYTPEVLGYGLRIKAVIAQPSESVRIYLKTPLIYYPKMSAAEPEPWALAWPTINVEWKLKNEARVWAGMGLLGAACMDYLLGSEEMIAGEDPYPGTMMKKEEAEAALYNTIQIGYSKPLSNRLSWQVEVAPIMKGLKFTNPKGLINNIPVVVTLGMSYSL